MKSTATITEYDRSPVVKTARELLDSVGYSDVPIQMRRGKRAAAGRNRIVIGNALTREDEEWQRWCGAHEAAHVVLRHGAWPAKTQALLVAGAIFYFGCMIVSIFNLPANVALSLSIALALAALAFVVAGILHGCATQRQRERDADGFAASWGYPVTGAIADRIAREESRFFQRRWWLPFRQHDLPADRNEPIVLGERGRPTPADGDR